MAPPTADVALVAGAAASMVYESVVPESTYRGSLFSRNGALAISGAAAAAFLASSIYGEDEVSSCRAAYPQGDRRDVELPPPRSLPPPPGLAPPAPSLSAPASFNGGTSTPAASPDAGVMQD